MYEKCGFVRFSREELVAWSTLDSSVRLFVRYCSIRAARTSMKTRFNAAPLFQRVRAYKYRDSTIVFEGASHCDSRKYETSDRENFSFRLLAL